MSIPSMLSEFERVLNENAALRAQVVFSEKQLNELRAKVAELEDLIVQLRSQPPSYPRALETRLAEAERLLREGHQWASPRWRENVEAFLASGDTAKEDGQ